MIDAAVNGRGGYFCEGPPFIVGDARRVRVPQRRVRISGCSELPVDRFEPSLSSGFEICSEPIRSHRVAML